jgi:hypothetical protein
VGSIEGSALCWIARRLEAQRSTLLTEGEVG